MTDDRSWLSRTELLIGKEGLQKMADTHVMVVGLGGVGSYAAEFIARGGIGCMTIIDGDRIENSNRNRQLPALSNNLGQSKAFVMAERLRAINPDLKLNVVQEFVTPEMVDVLLSQKPDYIIDAIDSIQPKISFISSAWKTGLPLVSSMGAGGKMDPTQIKVADISKTYNCPFAQQVRKQLKLQYSIRNGIQAVFSPEIPPKESLMLTDGSRFKKSSYGTVSYMPAALGGAAASVVIRQLLGR